MFFKTYWILGQNARNLNYIKWENYTISRSLADSKLKTKDFLSKKGIKVPITLLILKKHEELKKEIFENLEPPFVVKPNNWFGWKWIIVFESKDWLNNYISNTWKVYWTQKLLKHFENILDWFFSLSWWRDKVLIEKKIILNSEIELLWKYWLPDIRVIVYNMVPVMAMLRVPTKESWWKANLHAWACWVWIDIWTWKLTYMTRYSRLVKSIPGIWDVRWIKIPAWDEILTIAVKVQQKTWIGYLWCDIVLDENDWPLILEMNIRAGLEVQVANIAPLKDRLERVEWVSINSVEKWVRLGRDLFSWDIEEKIKNISWKKVLWLREYISIYHNEKNFKYLADIKMSSWANIIWRNFASSILKISEETLSYWSLRLDVDILWEKRKMKFIVKDLENKNIILWINSLKWFLIDPYKYRKWEIPVSWDFTFLKGKNSAINKTHEEQINKIDKALISIDKKLLILKYLNPINSEEEKQKFIASDWEYVPVFKYPEIKLDLDHLLDKVKKIDIRDIPLSRIYIEKREEIINKIKLLKAVNSWDSKDITIYSKKLYWDIDLQNLTYSNEVLKSSDLIKEEEENLSYKEIKEFVNKFNHIYNIKIHLKESDRMARFVMKWDDLLVRKDALVWKKEIRSIIAHEIEGHYLRKINWKKIKYSIFSHWTANYLEIDEWIAIYNQNRFITENSRKYYAIYERYFFVNFALKNSYKRLINEMKEYYNWDLEKVFTFMSRLKRWLKRVSDDWIFVRDIVYVNWYLKVENFVESWWDLKELYLWKISIEDLDILKESYFIKLNFNDLKTPFFL